MLATRLILVGAAVISLSACGNGGAGNAAKAGETSSNNLAVAAPAVGAPAAAAPTRDESARSAVQNQRKGEAAPQRDRREPRSLGDNRHDDGGSTDMPIDTYEPHESEEEDGSTEMPIDTYKPQG